MIFLKSVRRKEENKKIVTEEVKNIEVKDQKLKGRENLVKVETVVSELKETYAELFKPSLGKSKASFRGLLVKSIAELF